MKCKTCGKNAESEYCFIHKPRKPLKSNTVMLTSRKGKELFENALKQEMFFKDIWNKRRHYSEVSGKYLGSEILSVFFHHILPKEKYPDFRFNEENIILLTLEEHDQVEMDMYRYDEINQRRKLLLLEYERSK